MPSPGRCVRLICTPWFGVYVRDVDEADPCVVPHNHSRAFVSVVLRGGYEEIVWNEGGGKPYRRRWLPSSWHRMDRVGYHRIVATYPRTRTLVLTGPRRSSWGFWTENGHVDWMTYLGVSGNA